MPWLRRGMGIRRLCRPWRQSHQEGITWQSQVTRKTAVIINLSQSQFTMNPVTLDETKLKELLKVAIFELIQEEKEMFSEILSDVIENIGMINAIKEGEQTELVNQEEIFKILEQ
ncbi:hypothetical protein PN441_17280 [Spirulina major CS-329]|nr:hypothetical protein [Spirulina subsalsa CS-330]MDB9504833.1 hypothetical protein [Spirulina major CS-329]